MKVSHLDELARWIVGFGGRARVEAPEELRARVVELAEGALGGHRPKRGAKGGRGRAKRRRPAS